MKGPVTVGMVQDKPALLDIDAGLNRLEKRIKEAAALGVQLLVFGETFLTGYPVWLDYGTQVANWNHPSIKSIFAQMMDQGVEVPGPITDHLGALAQKHQMVLAVGINERVRKGPGNGTLYNSFLLFDATGDLKIHHRKLVPTYTERLVHGPGDAFGLKAVDTAVGRVGGLICWEHWMPLARQAMHDSGEDIHLALWPSVHDLHQVASRHYAFEGRCYVVAVGQLMQVSDLPKTLSFSAGLSAQPEQWLMNGNSCIVGPDGNFLRPPESETAGILTFELPGPHSLYEERMNLDVTGHYQRRDVFQFSVNRQRHGADGEVTP